LMGTLSTAQLKLFLNAFQNGARVVHYRRKGERDTVCWKPMQPKPGNCFTF
jgi:hypothetical protein